MEKSESAFRTIGEVSAELGVPQHVLRYWETRFSQLRPVQRAGNRRYYRPADVALARRIRDLLGQEGYTMRGVQKLLSAKSTEPDAPLDIAPVSGVTTLTAELRGIRAMLAAALAAAS